MKHLIHEKHHRHLKKRAILELFGLLILIGISLVQREILQESLKTVSGVDGVWFLLLLGLFWVVLPFTALSYKAITPKPKKFRLGTTTLAHLAGAGPGRIIPGGIGNLSISAVHLKKTGLTIEQAIGVVVTNNVFGFFVSITLVLTALIVRPETITLITNRLSSDIIIISLLFTIFLLVMLQWLMHARSTRKEVKKTYHQWKIILFSFLHKPKKIIYVLLIGLLIAILNTLMLDFSAFAIGTNIGFADALIALSFGVAIGGVFPTPGGVGGVEAGIIATLVVLGYDPATATSIAVLYRIATYWQPLIPGTIAYLYLRERNLL